MIEQEDQESVGLQFCFTEEMKTHFKQLESIIDFPPMMIGTEFILSLFFIKKDGRFIDKIR